MAATERLQEAVAFILARLDVLERRVTDMRPYLEQAPNASSSMPKGNSMNITVEMIAAGVEALEACDLDADEPEKIVRSVLEAAALAAANADEQAPETAG